VKAISATKNWLLADFFTSALHPHSHEYGIGMESGLNMVGGGALIKWI
jgi:hypothetical protein